MGLNLTETAAREVLNIIKQQNETAQQGGEGEGGGVATAVKPLYLRVGVKGGGCSGFSYSLDLTETKTEQDEEFNINGVEVICDSKSYIYLNGVEIDFKDEVMGRGFVFKNPNATSSCGCGSSFSV